MNTKQLGITIIILFVLLIATFIAWGTWQQSVGITGDAVKLDLEPDEGYAEITTSELIRQDGCAIQLDIVPIEVVTQEQKE